MLFSVFEKKLWINKYLVLSCIYIYIFGYLNIGMPEYQDMGFCHRTNCLNIDLSEHLDLDTNHSFTHLLDVCTSVSRYNNALVQRDIYYTIRTWDLDATHCCSHQYLRLISAFTLPWGWWEDTLRYIGSPNFRRNIYLI